ncbi:c-type cytochrome biogenesis protein CcmI [Palleronia pelagia]|uniref:Cytochrome c-type biogenesis protein CcmH n=1 Tax=Palleronia pelagia TaxID=387096 RepID=A0A1H8I320_9RHOB|nr:c-type cytochrome biogenesis protein CcmI [Palleronia pelagia]SEN62869.1 cytochrome c-type biogenesis protein CcmH [Palleronia pelagia]
MTLFWLITGALVVLTLLPVVMALLRGGGDGRGTDLAIYRDQLAEVERDLERGLLSEDEAARTRIEVQRRMLDADRRERGVVSRLPRGTALVFGGVIALSAAAGTFALYSLLGAPGYPDLPLAERIAQADAARDRRPSQAEAEAQAAPMMPEPPELDPDFDRLLTQLRQVMDERPDDLQGYRLLARNEAAIGNFPAARAAQERLVELLGPDVTAEDLAMWGELMVLSAGGFVSSEAEAVLDRALAADPRNGRAAYYKGLALAQIGRPDQAFAIWRGLLERGPEEAPWIEPVRGQIGQVAAAAGIRYDAPAPAAPRGPTAADMEAAADMSPEDLQAMIGNMVSGLSQRLATEGGPSSDWARLIVALSVLGQTDRARAILDEARGVFAGSQPDLDAIAAAADRAGLSE